MEILCREWIGTGQPLLMVCHSSSIELDGSGPWWWPKGAEQGSISSSSMMWILPKCQGYAGESGVLWRRWHEGHCGLQALWWHWGLPGLQAPAFGRTLLPHPEPLQRGNLVRIHFNRIGTIHADIAGWNTPAVRVVCAVDRDSSSAPGVRSQVWLRVLLQPLRSASVRSGVSFYLLLTRNFFRGKKKKLFKNNNHRKLTLKNYSKLCPK